MKFCLAIDQGTSSTKVIIIDAKANCVAKGVANLETFYLPNGYVEQNPDAIYRSVLEAVANCLKEFSKKGYKQEDIKSIGISNQRETFVLWDKNGKPLHNAIVWQCKRSVAVCNIFNKDKKLSKAVQQKTGLLIDPYFSATKIIALLKEKKEIKKELDKGNIFFGTVDTWLLYKLSNGASYYTDHTNASRTLLFNLKTLDWDKELVQQLGLSKLNVPQCKTSAAYFGTTTCNNLFKTPIPITAMIGDSQSAAFGEACLQQGMAKATLGTGCSLLLNIGNKPTISKNGMVTTVAYTTATQKAYAYEGVIVTCGAAIEWLKNELQLFTQSSETETMANAVKDNGGVYLIPAFSGLGSPHWQMDRLASFHGIKFGTTKNHLVRATLEAIVYQIKDIISAMENDANIEVKKLMINGGMSNNNFLTTFLTNLLQKDIAKAAIADVSALGAALLSGLEVGVYKDLNAIEKLIKHKNIIKTNKKSTIEQVGYAAWQRLIKLKY